VRHPGDAVHACDEHRGEGCELVLDYQVEPVAAEADADVVDRGTVHESDMLGPIPGAVGNVRRIELLIITRHTSRGYGRASHDLLSHIGLCPNRAAHGVPLSDPGASAGFLFEQLDVPWLAASARPENLAALPRPVERQDRSVPAHLPLIAGHNETGNQNESASNWARPVTSLPPRTITCLGSLAGSLRPYLTSGAGGSPQCGPGWHPSASLGRSPAVKTARLLTGLTWVIAEYTRTAPASHIPR